MRTLAVLSLFLFIGFFMPARGKPLQFVEHTIATDLPGGYQVVVFDLNQDGKPDLIALASGMAELVWYENPHWQRHIIAGGFSQMINLAIFNSGAHPIIVLASDFSSEAKNSQGTVWVLEPGSDVRGHWNKREIDRLPTSHRLRLADIDGLGRKVIINAPLTASQASSPDYRGHVPLVYYSPGEWKRRLIGDENEGVMHGIFVTDWEGDGKDEILSASFSGIHRYQLNSDGRWLRTEISRGDPAPWPKCGSSDVAVGQLKGRRFLCSIEPWHGHQVAFYREEAGTWIRQIIDDSLVEGHTIVAADLNGDGDDEIIAGYRGSGGGVYIYTAQEDQRLPWIRRELDKGNIAAASCVVADLNGDGKPDIACIGSATANLKWYENR
jgi:hypothetical protein